MGYGEGVNQLFQSTLPARGATVRNAAREALRIISIHAPCTGSDGVQRRISIQIRISIHAPCTGSDPIRFINSTDEIISIHAPCTGSDAYFNMKKPICCISIHAPCTGSDTPLQIRNAAAKIFQSTLPARGATGARRRGAACVVDFNPRSLHGERPHHVLNREPSSEFQSTLPARGATFSA